MEVYLDNSATTRAYECVRDIVGKVMCEDYGNPSSMHKKGVDAEVIDARTLVPFDKETLLNSVKKTHRLAIVSEAVRTSSFASEIAMIVSEECIDELDENIIRITSPDCPIPYSPVLEDAYVPNSDKVVEKVMELF